MARSKAYPGVALDACVEQLKAVRRAIGPGPHSREAMADAVGVASNTFIRTVAAMCHFGLMVRASDGYQVTDLGRQVLDPLDGELPDAMHQAVYNPRLYSQVLTHFETEGQLPNRLATVLHRRFGITHNAADLAAKILIRSAEHAGVIDGDLRFMRTKGAETPLPREEDDQRAATVSDVKFKNTAEASVVRSDSDQQEFYFRLTEGRFALLRVPAELNSRDIEIITKQIELLELQVGDG